MIERIISAVLLSGILFTTVSFAETKQPRNEPIQFEITTHLGDNQTFKQGDVISFMVSLDKDAYLSLIYQDASGNLIQILPNELASNNFYEAGLFLAVPNREQAFRLTVSPPFGRETLWGFASSAPLPTLTGESLHNGFVIIGKDMAEVLKTLRPKQTGIQYGEAKTTLTTIAD